MIESDNSKRYYLEDRTYEFAKDCRSFVKILSRTISTMEDCKQLIRSSGSVAASYIEANESFGKLDFKFRTKVRRKEAKESRLWLRLLDVDGSKEFGQIKTKLMQEALELTKIFGAILEKSK